jgi:WD40 repeat protein/serine/threonine protein kinase
MHVHKPELEESLFEAALEILSADQRELFLNVACQGNRALRSRLDALLEGHFGGDGFLARDPGRDPASLDEDQQCQVINRYKLLEKIGEGGFGEVWMAEQREPVKRRVALKILKLGMDTRQVVGRFDAERQALALMDHPNIAKVFDGGATDSGRPYFVMELVRGVKITEYCDKNLLPTEERLKLFILVCHAIQHAHQKGIIHRDIKPSNILVTLHDGVPVPKVIDFGIAKAAQGSVTDRTIFTQLQQFIGTPAYVSPEQAEMSGLDVDTRSDIYSLGVLLYELLVGQTPFDVVEVMKGGIDSLRRVIRDNEPVKPSTKLKTLPAQELTSTAQRRQTDPLKLTRQMGGDLDWIVMKCLEKDRRRRFETANGLAMDLQRYLANEPVTARPPSAAYRIRKLIQRNKLAFTAGAFILLVFLGGLGGIILVQRNANREFRKRLYTSELNRAGLAWQSGQSAGMRALLDRCPPDLRNWEWTFLHHQLERWQQSTLFSINDVVGGAALSADARLIAISAGGKLSIHAYPGGDLVQSIPFSPAWQSPFSVSPKDDSVATLEGSSGTLTIWDMRTGRELLHVKHGEGAGGLAWFHNGKSIATGGNDGIVHVWDATTGREMRHFSIGKKVTGLGIAYDDQTIAVGTSGVEVRLIDATTGEARREFHTRGPFNSQLIFSPDGRKLLIGNGTGGGFRNDKRVWSLEDGGSMDLNSGEGIHFAFSSDSQRLAVADGGGLIQLWDLEQRVELERFSANVGWSTFVHILPDNRILSAGSDGALKISEPKREAAAQLKGYGNSLRVLSFSSDSRWIAAGGSSTNVPIWSVAPGAGSAPSAIYTKHASVAFAVAFSPDGKVASCSSDLSVRVWVPSTLETLWSASLAPSTPAWWLAFSPDARRLYVASNSDTLHVFDAATGRKLKSLNGLVNTIDGLAISPDGSQMVLCQKSLISVRDALDLHEIWSAPAAPDRCASFSPDGQWIATGDLDGGITLWQVKSGGRVRRTLRGHSASVKGLSFHPDGTRLVSCSVDGQVKIWDWREGVELLNLAAPGHGILWSVLFSPDGRMIAAAGGDGNITIWRQ